MKSNAPIRVARVAPMTRKRGLFAVVLTMFVATFAATVSVSAQTRKVARSTKWYVGQGVVKNYRGQDLGKVAVALRRDFDPRRGRIVDLLLASDPRPSHPARRFVDTMTVDGFDVSIRTEAGLVGRGRLAGTAWAWEGAWSEVEQPDGSRLVSVLRVDGKRLRVDKRMLGPFGGARFGVVETYREVTEERWRQVAERIEAEAAASGYWSRRLDPRPPEAMRRPAEQRLFHRLTSRRDGTVTFKRLVLGIDPTLPAEVDEFVFAVDGDRLHWKDEDDTRALEGRLVGEPWRWNEWSFTVDGTRRISGRIGRNGHLRLQVEALDESGAVTSSEEARFRAVDRVEWQTAWQLMTKPPRADVHYYGPSRISLSTGRDVATAHLLVHRRIDARLGRVRETTVFIDPRPTHPPREETTTYWTMPGRFILQGDGGDAGGEGSFEPEFEAAWTAWNYEKVQVGGERIEARYRRDGGRLIGDRAFWGATGRKELVFRDELDAIEPERYRELYRDLVEARRRPKAVSYWHGASRVFSSAGDELGKNYMAVRRTYDASSSQVVEASFARSIRGRFRHARVLMFLRPDGTYGLVETERKAFRGDGRHEGERGEWNAWTWNAKTPDGKAIAGEARVEGERLTISRRVTDAKGRLVVRMEDELVRTDRETWTTTYERIRGPKSDSK